MLEIIYNDSYSMLTILNNLNNECFNVVDDEFNTYETLTYNTFEPTKKHPPETEVSSENAEDVVTVIDVLLHGGKICLINL